MNLATTQLKSERASGFSQQKTDFKNGFKKMNRCVKKLTLNKLH